MSASVKFRKLFTQKELRETCNKYLNFNTAKGIDNIGYNVFIKSLDNNIEIIYNKIKSGTYTFTPFREKLILKSRTSYPRLISIPTLRDRIVLKSLQLLLKEVFSDIEQKLPQFYIQELKNNIFKYNCFMKLDISNFYGSISHGILLDKIGHRIKTKNALRLINDSIKTSTVMAWNSKGNKKIECKGVPQGIPISNILAQIYLNDLDSKFQNRTDLKYIRYVDDIIILCNKNIYIKVYREITYELEGLLNLCINKDKEMIGYITPETKFSFLGYEYSMMKNKKMGLTVKEQSKVKLENSIVAIFNRYKYDNSMSPSQLVFILNNKITGSISKKIDRGSEREYKYGWLFYFSQIDDIGLLYHLDNFIQELLDRYEKCKSVDRTEVKSFVKAFFEIRYNIKNTKYIHKPDDLTIDEKKKVLIDVFGIRNFNLHVDTVEKLYYKYVYKPIKIEQIDIQKIIS